jgi:charged multivesicular body protein 5
VPEDVDEEELMGELEGLEDELAAEATTGGSVPAYLQDVDLPEVPTGQQAQQAQPQAADEFGLPAMPQRT